MMKRRAAARWACSRNVFLHLHPAKINRDAVAYNYTWGMGGMTFYVYITLVFTGTLLMFYYHPSKVMAFRDILYLEHDVPFGKLLRNMHRWGAHLMVIMVELHMFRVFLTGSYKKPREFNWVVGVHSAGSDPAAQLHRLSAARRSAGLLGRHGRNQHGARDAAARPRWPVRPPAWHDAVQRRSLRVAGRIDCGFERPACAPTSGTAWPFRSLHPRLWWCTSGACAKMAGSPGPRRCMLETEMKEPKKY